MVKIFLSSAFVIASNILTFWLTDIRQNEIGVE
jgi:hypothetical protein